MADTIEDQIITRIRENGAGWTFSPKDFLDLGTRTAIDVCIHRLLAVGTIRRVMYGIYDCPKEGKLTGKPLSPDIWSVAQTIARKSGWKIVPSGDAALNALGLSTQVPGKYIFFTDGKTRDYKLGKRVIQFRKRAPKDLQMVDGRGAVVVQALKALGKERIDENVIQGIREQLTPDDMSELMDKARYGTDWVYAAIKEICKENGER
jgi:hypothetical protein